MLRIYAIVILIIFMFSVIACATEESVIDESPPGNQNESVGDTDAPEPEPESASEPVSVVRATGEDLILLEADQIS